MKVTILSSAIPDDQRRYKPENREVLTPLQLQDAIDRGLRSVAPSNWSTMLSREAVEDLLRDVHDDYVQLSEAYRDAVARELTLRGGLMEGLTASAGAAMNDVSLDADSLVSEQLKVLVATYGFTAREGAWVFWDPDTAGPPETVEIDVEARAQEVGRDD